MRLCTDFSPSSDSEPHTFGQPMRQKLKSSPEEHVHIFVSQPAWLTRFLEYMISVDINSSTVVYNTLLELYLKEEVCCFCFCSLVLKGYLQGTNRQLSRDKAIELLKGPNSNFDLDQALVLAKMYDFKPGLLYLYERNKLFQEILQYYMDNNEYANLLLACKKYGYVPAASFFYLFICSFDSAKDPNLWVQVLSYFAAKKEDCRKEITDVLANIDKLNLLPPLQVIQILSQNSNVTLSVVKDYIAGRMQTEEQQIREDQRQIRQFQVR